jgi:hypothetical protein
VESLVFSSDSFFSLLFVLNDDRATDANFEFDLTPSLDNGFVLSHSQRSLQDANSLT